MSSTFFTYLELMLVTIVWGATFVAAKHVLAEVSPVMLATSRFLIASLIFLPLIFILRVKGVKVEYRDPPSLLLLSFLGISLYFILQYIGVSYTTATNAALIVTLIPATTALISFFLLGERLRLLNTFGILVAFFGAALVILNGTLEVSARINDIIGGFFIFLNVLCFSFYTVLGKRVLKEYSPLLTTSYIIVFGTASLSAIAVASGDMAKLPVLFTLKPTHLFSILYLALAGSVLAYFLYYHALKKVEASKAAVFLYFEPLVTAALATTFLGEVLTIFTVGGGVLIILGVFISTRRWVFAKLQLVF